MTDILTGQGAMTDDEAKAALDWAIAQAIKISNPKDIVVSGNGV